MAERKRNRRYRTDGSTAYQPEPESAPVRAPARRERGSAAPVCRPVQPRRPQIRPRRRPAVRPNIQVRSQTAVADRKSTRLNSSHE